jgi:hypothetical protein
MLNTGSMPRLCKSRIMFRAPVFEAKGDAFSENHLGRITYPNILLYID